MDSSSLCSIIYWRRHAAAVVVLIATSILAAFSACATERTVSVINITNISDWTPYIGKVVSIDGKAENSKDYSYLVSRLAGVKIRGGRWPSDYRSREVVAVGVLSYTNIEEGRVPPRQDVDVSGSWGTPEGAGGRYYELTLSSVHAKTP